MNDQKQSNNSKSVQWLAISIIIASLLISGSILYSNYQSKSTEGFNRKTGQDAGNQPLAKAGQVSIDDDAVLGDKAAPLTMIEFSDFQCPFCRKLWKESLSQIKKEYIDTGKLKFVYRDFPLSPHPAAEPAALAAECAKEQGKFWEMHNKIFQEQDKQGTGTIAFAADDLKKWASQIGLNAAKFNQCLDSAKYKGEVEKDYSDGIAAGVTGTPASFIGKSTDSGVIEGTLVSGAQPFSEFKTVIDQLLSN